MRDAEIDGELVARNLNAFAKYMESMFKALVDYQPQSRLVINDDECLDVEFRGQCLYDGDGRQMAEDDVEKLRLSNAGRLRVYPPGSKSLDRQTSDFLFRLLKHGVDDGVTFLVDPADPECYHLVVFGLGLGYHLAELATLTKARSICIVEPNMDFIFHSLGVIEWLPILELREKWPAAVSIVTADTAPAMALGARGHCRNNNPTALDWTLVAQSYTNPSMAQAVNHFLADAQMVSTGLGFFYDELEMVRASYFNLVRGEGYRLFRAKPPARAKLPAFIVGSGPSIDEDLEFLRENQDKAVIFSCGSALGVLLSKGIQPDFQLILENGEPPRLMLEGIAEKYDFGDLILFASNTVSPQMAGLFKERVYFIRPALSSCPMYSPGQEFILPDPSPTVTNTGLAAALAMGFSDIYLFGTDLGSRVPAKHHSKFSPYKMDGRQADYSQDQELVTIANFTERALANFGGIVFTDFIMAWARDSMESMLAGGHPGQHVYNCSDGVRIKGTKAQISSTIKMPAVSHDKKEAVRALMDHFPKGSDYAISEKWRQEGWRERVHALGDRLIKVCEDQLPTMADFLQEMIRLAIPDLYRATRFEEFFLRGTVLMGLIAADYYEHRAHDAEKRVKFRHDLYEQFVQMVREQMALTDWYFDHLDEMESSLDLKAGVDKWLSPVDASAPAA